MFSDISEQWVKTAEKKRSDANITGVIVDDLRGKHLNRPFKVPDEMKDAARHHIKSFPRMESHYCRANSKVDYLEEGLSVTKMHEMYSASMQAENNDNIVSEQMYRTLCNYEYNISSHVPKKDE